MWLIATQDFTFGAQSYLSGERFEMGLRDAFSITKKRWARAMLPPKQPRPAPDSSTAAPVRKRRSRKAKAPAE